VRVLAVTGNASLVVALGSMMRDWEVVTARNADEALDNVQGAIVALIDLSDTSSGIEIADHLYRSGVTIPCVIIGDSVADHPRASVLVRPFSLEDLGTAVKIAADRGSGPAAAPSRPQPEPPADEHRFRSGRRSPSAPRAAKRLARRQPPPLPALRRNRRSSLLRDAVASPSCGPNRSRKKRTRPTSPPRRSSLTRKKKRSSPPPPRPRRRRPT